MVKTSTQCEGCRERVHQWYEMGDEGDFCPICFCVWYPEKVTDIERERAEEFEANGG